MLCHHTGECPLGRCVLQSSSRLKCSQPVRIIPGIFLGFLLQRVGTELHLLVKYGVDFRLGNIASLLTENSRLDFSNRLCSISLIYNGI